MMYKITDELWINFNNVLTLAIRNKDSVSRGNHKVIVIEFNSGQTAQYNNVEEKEIFDRLLTLLNYYFIP